MGAAHRTAAYKRQARAIVTHANNNPDTRCWNCWYGNGLTLDQHPPHTTGRPPRWTAGHINDSEIGGELRAQVSVCNFKRGGWRLVNQRQRQHTNPTSRAW